MNLSTESIKALSFLRSFVRKLVAGKIEITVFGTWDTKMGEYGMSLYWREKEEKK